MTSQSAVSAAPPTDEEARSFLQERLAFLGKTYALIDLSFFVVSAIVGGPLRGWTTPFTDLNSRLVLSVIGVFLAQWLICRRGRRSESTLRLIDSGSTVGATALTSAMLFGGVPGELPGLSYGRALLLFTLTVVFRAIIVPSSARRTLVLGLLATVVPVVAASVWYSANASSANVPPIFQTVWTLLWCLGGVVISTVASQVIFGLRRQVREAWQLGQYTLLEKIGAGGMGEVYRASHAMLRRPTAVKLLRPGRTSAEHLRRFEQEVQLTSRLTHPNTVAVFDYGRTVDGVFYYAMEYLDGVNLEDLVRHGGAQPSGRVRHILRQVAGSLAEAHGVGLIHRDIKPGNVILVPERGGARDVAKVVDFGLVRDLEQEADAGDGEHFAGTPLYLAPEAVGDSDTVDVRSDLYSLGCVGYFLLTGKPVFQGETVIEVVGSHLHAKPIPPDQRLGSPLPADLCGLLLSCLEKDPALRPPSALACIAALDACDDVPAWTDEHASTWWRAEGARLLERRSGARAAPTTTEATIVRPGSLVAAV